MPLMHVVRGSVLRNCGQCTTPKHLQTYQHQYRGRQFYCHHHWRRHHRHRMAFPLASEPSKNEINQQVAAQQLTKHMQRLEKHHRGHQRSPPPRAHPVPRLLRKVVDLNARLKVRFGLHFLSRRQLGSYREGALHRRERRVRPVSHARRLRSFQYCLHRKRFALLGI